MEVKTAENLFAEMGYSKEGGTPSYISRYYVKKEGSLTYVVSFMEPGRTVMAKHYITNHPQDFKDTPIDPYLLRAINAQFAELEWVAI